MTQAALSIHSLAIHLSNCNWGSPCVTPKYIKMRKAQCLLPEGTQSHTGRRQPTSTVPGRVSAKHTEPCGIKNRGTQIMQVELGEGEGRYLKEFQTGRWVRLSGPWGGHPRGRKLPLQRPGGRNIPGQPSCIEGTCGEVATGKGVKEDRVRSHRCVSHRVSMVNFSCLGY